MFRLLIVDDEYPVRAGLRKVVPWEKADCLVVGEAANGRQALAALEETKIDLVLTDLRMPVMDGLSFMRAAREKGFPGEFIVLTCHAEFELAQEALRLGAADYVLKAEVSGEELLAVVRRVAARLEEKRRLQGQAARGSDLIRQDFYRRLIRGEMTAKEIEEGLAHLGIALPPENLYLMFVAVDPSPPTDTRERIRHLLGKLINADDRWLVEDRVFLGFLALPGLPTSAARRTVLAGWAGQIHRTLQEYGIASTVGISAEHQQHTAWPFAYREAREAAETARFFRGWGQTLFYEELPPSPAYPLTPEEIDRLALEALTTGKTVEIEARLMALATRGAVQAGALAVMVACGRYLGECGRNARHLFGGRDLSQEIYTCYDFPSVVNLLTAFIGEIRQYLATEGCEGKNMVRKAAAWLKQHYTEEITLPRLAREFGLNPSYLSLLFKKEMGQSFMTYLTQIRIEKAKELLALPGLKTQEIAEAVGYPNAHYFSRLFRRLTGMTPSAYREKILTSKDLKLPSKDRPF